MVSFPNTNHGPPTRARKPTHPGSSNRQQGVAAMPARGPAHRANVDWRTWPELTVKVHKLPDYITTAEMHEIFRIHGNISKIELFENYRNERSGDGSVTFTPPPSTAFWERSPLEVRFEEPPRFPIVYRVDLIKQDPRRSFYYPSPVRAGVKYPELMTINAAQLGFGFMHSADDMMGMHAVDNTRGELVRFTVSLLRREVVIGFYSGVPQNPALEKRRYKVVIPLRDLESLWEVPKSNTEISLVINLTTPPKFFRKVDNVQTTHDEGRRWTETSTWARQTAIPRSDENTFKEPLTYRNERALIDIGRWTTYKLDFHEAITNKNVYGQILRALEEHNIKIIPTSRFSVLPRKDASVWDVIDDPKPTRGSSAGWLAELTGDVLKMTWPVRYQLESCISQGCINERNVTRDFVERLNHIGERQAMLLLELATDKQHRFWNPMDIFELQIPKSVHNRIPKYCILQRSATVTPSTIYLSTPTPEMSNRILRKYAEHADRFLRVRFADEKNEGRIFSSIDNSNTAIYNRVYQCLKYGIKIGDRRFEFLAAGNSQFREHGAYFFASTRWLTTDMIRQNMGNFSEIKTVSKYASRLGLCFSTTRRITHPVMTVKTLDDTMRNGYNFTDGVGRISSYLAQTIAADLRLPSTNVPSVFQFRLGGAKGVLAVAPKLDALHLNIRQSQYKFHAAYNIGMEIIKWSQYSTPRLNRQLISVLKSLKVSDDVFKMKLDAELTRLQQAMVDGRAAILMLERQVDENHTTLDIAEIVRSGFISTKDPFAVSMLHLWRSWCYKQLKERAAIPMKEGAFLLGCTDETRTLRGWFEGAMARASERATANVYDRQVQALSQIFVQVPDPEQDGRHKVIEGLCIVARNPSLHPGDIRVVQAVDVQALHHLRDVVVFPQTGDRDVPNMCSGGDLDGDDFIIVWDKDLIPQPSEWDVLAMDFKGTSANEVDKIRIDDVARFFVQYMQKDTLRSIATWHLANADSLLGGVKNPRCLELAEQHSIAVDYPKSGIPPDPSPKLRPQLYPHFMPSKYRAKDKIYHSRTILGQLYDRVPELDFKPLFDLPFDDRILNAFDHSEHEERLRIVTQIKLEYDAAVRRVMAQHEIATEFEIWSSFIMNHAKVVNDYKITEEMGRISASLKEQYIEIVQNQAGGSEFEKVAPWVAAMYTVTAREATAKLKALKADGELNDKSTVIDPSKMPLISFPWIFHREVCKIAMAGKKPTLPLAETSVQASQRPMKIDKTNMPLIDTSDIIETAEGTVHGGEELVLHFNNPKDQQDPQSESDEEYLLVGEATVEDHVDARTTGGPPDKSGYPTASPRRKKSKTPIHKKSKVLTPQMSSSGGSSASIKTGISTPNSSASESSAPKTRADAVEHQHHRLSQSLSRTGSESHKDLAGWSNDMALKDSTPATPAKETHISSKQSALSTPLEKDDTQSTAPGTVDWLCADEEHEGEQEITIDIDEAPSSLDRLTRVLKGGSGKKRSE